MDIRKHILEFARSQSSFTTKQLLDSLNGKYSKAYVLRFVKDLIQTGKLVKAGSTRSARYALIDNADQLGERFGRRYKREDLREHIVLEEVMKGLLFLRRAPEHIQSIFSYAFSEMLNNAIDHSQSENVEILVEKKGDVIRFVVNDFGIGVFNNVMKDRDLNSPLEAIQDLLKGKVTTMPHAHSGEGIFFTSKVGDNFVLESFETQLKIDNSLDDVFVKDLKPIKNGTRVIFEISLKHKAHLDEIFKEYYTDPEDVNFDKTEIRVKLYSQGSIYVSRSQARRILSGLEKFKLVILDFDQVPTVGQAFVDEIFRVFKKAHPDIEVHPENMNESVRFMVERGSI